jgi:hypothetical protein
VKAVTAPQVSAGLHRRCGIEDRAPGRWPQPVTIDTRTSSTAAVLYTYATMSARLCVARGSLGRRAVAARPGQHRCSVIAIRPDSKSVPSANRGRRRFRFLRLRLDFCLRFGQQRPRRRLADRAPRPTTRRSPSWTSTLVSRAIRLPIESESNGFRVRSSAGPDVAHRRPLARPATTPLRVWPWVGRSAHQAARG